MIRSPSNTHQILFILILQIQVMWLQTDNQNHKAALDRISMLNKSKCKKIKVSKIQFTCNIREHLLQEVLVVQEIVLE